MLQEQVNSQHSARHRQSPFIDSSDDSDDSGPDLTLLEPEIRELEPGEARSAAAPRMPGPEDNTVQVSQSVSRCQQEHRLLSAAAALHKPLTRPPLSWPCWSWR